MTLPQEEKLLLCSHFEVLNFDNSLITAVSNEMEAAGEGGIHHLSSGPWLSLPAGNIQQDTVG